MYLLAFVFGANSVSRPSPQELIVSMLQVEVDQRYTALQVLEHPWVTVSNSD